MIQYTKFDGDSDRKRRVQRLKKLIVGTILAAILIPMIVCVLLLIYISGLKKEISILKAQQESMESISEENPVYSTADIQQSERGEQEELNPVKDGSREQKEKQIYLTFDDGPSKNTDAILDILKEYDVKATFFVVGKTDEQSKASYQRIVNEGHTLAMHSYSHQYNTIYESKESFVEDLGKLQEYLYQETDVWPRFYRFPGGSSNTVSKVDMRELIEYLTDSNITYFDWNVASGDAVKGTLPKETIVQNCLDGINRQSESIVLLHDTSDRRTTVEALPEIIEQLQKEDNTVFLPITDDTVPVQHIAALDQ